jgi:DNA-directed RNA polymerase sigma subunit (sigma70/sigma32)
MLEAMGRAPLLRRTETIELFRVYNAGREPDATRAQQRASTRARDRIYRCNLRLAVFVARGYRRRVERVAAMTFEDLIQESALGLHRAIEKFSIERGYEFSSYAAHWCRQAVTKAIMNQSDTIRLPIQIRECMDRVRHAPLGLDREALAAWISTCSMGMATS